MQAWVGLGVVIGPQVESWILRKTGNNGLYSFKALRLFSALHVVVNLFNLPETLNVENRISMATFFKSVTSFNPFSFLKIYLGNYPRQLRQFVTIHSFQCCLEGRCTSDALQMWTQNNLKWNTNQIQTFLSYWGMFVSSCALFTSPRLLKSMTPRAYTTLINLTLFVGISLW